MRVFGVSVKAYEDLRIMAAGPRAAGAFYRLASWVADMARRDSADFDPHRLSKSVVRSLWVSDRMLEKLVASKLLIQNQDGSFALCDLVLLESRRVISPALRQQVIDRDGYTCGICGGVVSRDRIHIDHIKPVSKGGRTVLANLRVTHATCNMRKGAR